MKKIIYTLLCCISIIYISLATTTTAYAQSNDVYCSSPFSVGDRIYLSLINTYDGSCGKTEVIFTIDEIATSETLRCCYFLEDGWLSPSGKTIFPSGAFPTIYSEMKNNGVSMGVGTGTQITQTTYPPYLYDTFNKDIVSSTFVTNIPIFENSEIAEKYVNGDDTVLSSAINYKKIFDFESGSWVTPFEDIEINDDNMSSPELSNVSHTGFTVINSFDDRYMVDVYLQSGIQSPDLLQKGLTTLDSTFYVNNYGLISDIEGAYTGKIDLLRCYGVDNLSALNESCRNFYNTYPSINSFNKDIGGVPDILRINTYTFSIWGKPFGKNYIFFSDNTSVSSSELNSITAYDCPLAYTSYKVRYFYFDSESGMHYGPWTHVVYFSDGRILHGTVFQGNDGSVVESPLQSGKQDSSGNITTNNTNLIDLENPNQLFGYLRSVINNVSATGNSFMTLFGTVFTFIPQEIQLIIWFGIGCIVLVGVVKAIRG